MIVETSVSTASSGIVTAYATLYNNYNVGDWEWQPPDEATAIVIQAAAHKAAWITDLDEVYPQYLVQRYAAPVCDFEDDGEDALSRPQYKIRGYTQSKYPLLLVYEPNGNWCDS